MSAFEGGEEKTDRPGLRSRFRDIERARRRHGSRCHCGRHDRVKRGRGAEDRDKHPERQHVPFLSLWIRNMAAESLKLARGDELVVELNNNGNAASFTPIVELFLQSGPDEIWRGGSAQLPPVYPHSSVSGVVPWSWQKLTPVGASPFVSITARERTIWITHLTAVCYDPTLDPKPPPPFDPWGQPAHHRKILTIPYWSDQSDNP